MHAGPWEWWHWPDLGVPCCVPCSLCWEQLFENSCEPNNDCSQNFYFELKRNVPVWAIQCSNLSFFLKEVGNLSCHHVYGFLSLQVWEEMFAPLHCLNFGIPEDKTQNVLWRIENGELENVSPKVQVSGSTSPREFLHFWCCSTLWLSVSVCYSFNLSCITLLKRKEEKLGQV